MVEWTEKKKTHGDCGTTREEREGILPPVLYTRTRMHTHIHARLCTHSSVSTARLSGDTLCVRSYIPHHVFAAQYR